MQGQDDEVVRAPCSVGEMGDTCQSFSRMGSRAWRLVEEQSVLLRSKMRNTIHSHTIELPENEGIAASAVTPYLCAHRSVIAPKSYTFRSCKMPPINASYP